MQDKLQAAKNAFDTKQYRKAKQIILEIIESNQYECNSKLFIKLGDICVKLREYEDAKDYYRKASDPNALTKLANLYQCKLDDIKNAELIYEECLRSHPNNEQCLYQYGNLMLKQHNYQKAKDLLQRCLEINDEKACVSFSFAQVLIAENDDNNNDMNITYLLQKCIEIKPSIAKYHYHFAMHLEKMNKLNQANHAYKQALKLVNYEDDDMQCKYIIFMHHMATLARLQETTSIKLVIYEFECVISYWNIDRFINGDLDQLRYTRSKDLVQAFGGYDRIYRIKQHFEEIISYHKDIRIIILSFTTTDIITESLRRVKLLQYIDLIIAKDTSPFLSRHHSKLYDIMKLKDDNHIFRSDEVIYIDSTRIQNEDISNECIMYIADIEKSKPMISLSPDDFDHIECIIKQQQYQLPDLPQDDERKSMIGMNEHLFDGMNEEIVKNYRTYGDHEPVENLPSYRWAKKQSQNNQDYNLFIHFAKKFSIVLQKENSDEEWTVVYMLKDLIFNFEKNSDALWRRYAKSLSVLRHNEAAEDAYNAALSINPRNHRTLTSLGYHLILNKDFLNANKRFREADRSANKPYNWSICVGLARTYEELGDHEKAEKYFKISIQENMKSSNKYFYIPCHYFYARFLNHFGRWRESADQYKICIDNIHWARNVHRQCLIHWGYANMLYKLKDFSGYEYHLNESLEIDPYLPDAIENNLRRRIPVKGTGDIQDGKEYKREGFEIETEHEVKANESLMSDQDTNRREFHLWLKDNNLLDQFRMIFDMNDIHTIEALRRTQSKFISNPVHRNVINHALDLLTATSIIKCE